MSILLSGLPYEIDGVAIQPDFRNMIRLECIMRDEELAQNVQLQLALCQLYREIPEDVQWALHKLMWFYSRGKNAEASVKSAQPAFDFEQDAEMICADFYAVYGLWLAEIEFLHWWEFMLLFEGLPHTAMMKKVMYWRTADTTKMSKEEKGHVLKMREAFALKRASAKRQSVEDVERRMKEWVARRYDEVQKALMLMPDKGSDKNAGDFRM